MASLASLAAKADGDLVVEFVDAQDHHREQIAAWLAPLVDGDAHDLATYLVADEVPSSAQVFAVEGVTARGPKIRSVRAYRSSVVCSLLPATSQYETPVLYATPVRVVTENGVLLVNWTTPGGYPRPPTRRQLDAANAFSFGDDADGSRWPSAVSAAGPADSARAAGISEEIIAFEYGPNAASLPRLAGLAEPAGGASLRVAESLINSIARSFNSAAQSCADALQGWETSFLIDATGDDPRVPASTPASYRRLAMIANLVGAVRNWTEKANSPTSHDPLYWFAQTEDSVAASDEFQKVLRRLDSVREEYRTALTVAAGIATSQQLEIQTRNERQAGSFQRAVALVGSVVLVPGLIASVYGANVPLPADHSWLGTLLLVVFMALAGAATWRLLTRDRTRRSGESE